MQDYDQFCRSKSAAVSKPRCRNMNSPTGASRRQPANQDAGKTGGRVAVNLNGQGWTFNDQQWPAMRSGRTLCPELRTDALPMSCGRMLYP
eukprot:363674-Chlamydomonas_euryale.AAC.5